MTAYEISSPGPADVAVLRHGHAGHAGHAGHGERVSGTHQAAPAASEALLSSGADVMTGGRGAPLRPRAHA